MTPFQHKQQQHHQIWPNYDSNAQINEFAKLDSQTAAVREMSLWNFKNCSSSWIEIVRHKQERLSFATHIKHKGGMREKT